MTDLNNNLVLHLKLDEIIKEGETKKLIDVSSQKNNGTIEGNPQIVADETFGSCLSFNRNGGSEDFVVLPPASIPKGNKITVSFWSYGGDSLPKNNYIIFAGKDNYRVLNVHSPWSDSIIYFDCGGNVDGSFDRIARRAQGSDFKGRWTHWTFTKNAAIGEMKIYVDGSLWHSETNKNQPILAATEANLGKEYDGKIANVRIYDKALSLEEIKQDMDDDRTAIASFNQTHPLDFNLYEGEDKEAVIFIENGTKGQELILEIANNSGQPIDLPPKSGVVNENNYHFELRFRPGTLSPESLKQLALGKNQDWRMSYLSQADGMVSLYFLKTNNQLNPDQTVPLTLEHINGAVAGGARTTRVELLCPQFTHQEETFKNYYREKSLSIISHRGKKNIPLHVGFVGSNQILNDGNQILNYGTKNTLTLRITNVLKGKDIPFISGSKGDQASKFTIYFDVGSDYWALGPADQVKEIDITGKDWQANGKPEEDWHIVKGIEGETPIWIITHQNEEKVGLAPGQVLQLTISNIISPAPSGNTNLYLRYENIPGYWDGTFICTVEKSPIVWDKNRNVGIGTTDPGNNKLKVQGNTAIVGNLNIALEGAGQLQTLGWTQGWNINTMTPGKHLYLNRDSDNNSNVFIGVVDKELFVRGLDGNVGIGTTDPGNNKLKVQGDTAIVGNLNIALEGAGQLQTLGWTQGWNINTMTPGKHLYLNRDSDNNSNVFIGVVDKELFVRGLDGNVGIGTTDPGTNKLKVQGNTEIAGTITATALQIGNTSIGERELEILKALANGYLQVDLFNAAHKEYLYSPNDGFKYDDDRRYAFTWGPKNRVNTGQWYLRFPNLDQPNPDS